MFFHHVERKCIVACGHRCVRCEDAGGPNLLGCIFEALARLNKLPHSLEKHERGVALICMKDGGLNSQGAEDSDSTNTENHFLTYAKLFVAPVKPRRKLPVTRLILLNVRVHQIKWN